MIPSVYIPPFPEPSSWMGTRIIIFAFAFFSLVLRGNRSGPQRRLPDEGFWTNTRKLRVRVYIDTFTHIHVG